jgi:hypothetical protein
MVDERITERTDATGTVTERTIETSNSAEPRASVGGGSSVFMIFLLVIAIAIALYIYSGMSKTEARKDDAVAGAASDIGDAAKDVGAAAKKAADNIAN